MKVKLTARFIITFLLVGCIPLIILATVLKSNANIQDEDAAPRREDAVVEARFLGVEK